MKHAHIASFILAISILLSGSSANASTCNTGSDKPTADIEIILDSSGSMAGMIGNKQKIQIAREAIENAVQGLPNETFVAFRAYGHQSAKEKKNCTDTELLVPMSKLDRPSIMSKVNALTPRGWTPIEYVLRQSKNDFKNVEGVGKSIILVSDGEETCGGDPCKAIKELKDSGFDVVVNTIGFDVNSKAKEELQCIASATGGKYTDARSAEDLYSGICQATIESIHVELPDVPPLPHVELPDAPELPYVPPLPHVELPDTPDIPQVDLPNATLPSVRSNKITDSKAPVSQDWDGSNISERLSSEEGYYTSDENQSMGNGTKVIAMFAGLSGILVVMVLVVYFIAKQRK